MPDLFTTPPKRAPIGAGNALFLCALMEPGITREKLRARVRAGEFPDLYPQCGGWVEMARIA